MATIATENDLSTSVQDMIAFCDYIDRESPKITASGALSSKACYAVNSLLSHPQPEPKKTDRMYRYASVYLYYLTAATLGLIEESTGGKLVVTEDYHEFRNLNDYTQYLLIFLTWLCDLDAEELYQNEPIRWTLIGEVIDLAFDQLASAPNEWISKQKNAQNYFTEQEPIQQLFYDGQMLLHHFCDMGLLKMQACAVQQEKRTVESITAVRPTSLGVALANACRSRRYSWVNQYREPCVSDQDLSIFESEDSLIGSPKFFEPFFACFPADTISKDAVNHFLDLDEGMEPDSSDLDILDDTGATVSSIMEYQFQVSLARNCYCVIKCGGHHTFKDLHDAIQEAFHFDNDHLYSFFLDGKPWSNYSVNSPYAEEPPFANEMRLDRGRLHLKKKFLYLFDYGDEWWFQVTLLSITQQTALLLRPQMIKFVGTAPEQYGDE